VVEHSVIAAHGQAAQLDPVSHFSVTYFLRVQPGSDDLERVDAGAHIVNANTPRAVHDA
jgi:hypothetical protein